MLCANTVRLLPPRAREVVSNRANQRNEFLRELVGAVFAAICLITAPISKWRYEMNQNINYIGMVNLLRHLQNAGLVSRKEAGRIAARLRAETGADVIYSP